MNKLSCAVKECVNYSSGLCCLEKIFVDGVSAMKSAGTSCASFVAKKNAAENSCARGNCASAETRIQCKAEKCVYNSNDKCTADKVNVGSVCPDVSTMSETECETFKMR